MLHDLALIFNFLLNEIPECLYNANKGISEIEREKPWSHILPLDMSKDDKGAFIVQESL